MKQAIVVWVSLGIGFAMGQAKQIEGPRGPQGPAGPAGVKGDTGGEILRGEFKPADGGILKDLPN